MFPLSPPHPLLQVPFLGPHLEAFHRQTGPIPMPHSLHLAPLSCLHLHEVLLVLLLSVILSPHLPPPVHLRQLRQVPLTQRACSKVLLILKLLWRRQRKLAKGQQIVPHLRMGRSTFLMCGVFICLLLLICILTHTLNCHIHHTVFFLGKFCIVFIYLFGVLFIYLYICLFTHMVAAISFVQLFTKMIRSGIWFHIHNRSFKIKVCQNLNYKCEPYNSYYYYYCTVLGYLPLLFFLSFSCIVLAVLLAAALPQESMPMP